MTKIPLIINGDQCETAEKTTVADLLAARGLAGRPVAVEVNEELVSHRDFATRLLEPGDRVEVVTLVGGG